MAKARRYEIEVCGMRELVFVTSPERAIADTIMTSIVAGVSR